MWLVGHCCSVQYLVQFQQSCTSVPSFIYLLTNPRNHRSLGRHTLTFTLATLCSIFSTICLLIASGIYTILVNKCKAMNSILLPIANSDQRIPVGIVVGGGNVIPLMWASVVCMMLAVIPFLIS